MAADGDTKCTCADFRNRGLHCKHVLFVLLRVLKIPFDQLLLPPHLGQAELTTQALLHFLLSAGVTDAPQLPDASEYEDELIQAVNADDSRSQARPERLAKRIKVRPAERVEVERKPIEDECAICFESFGDDRPDVPGGPEEIVYCRYGCGQNLHQDCFNKWADRKETVTCVYCRAIWF